MVYLYQDGGEIYNKKTNEMKFYKRLKRIKFFVLILLIITVIIVIINFQALNQKRSSLCDSTKLLTQIKVNKYDSDGVMVRSGTFTRKVSVGSKKQLKVIIFPRALSPQIWLKAPQSSIQYIGKGGDGNLQEWLRPDYFYSLEVPSQATGLAFGRLCYRNGDVEVEPIKKLKENFFENITINDKVYLSASYPLPKINDNTVVVNTGSNRLDSLGTATEVYFTTAELKID